METITYRTKSRIATFVQILALLMAIVMAALALSLLGVGIQITRSAVFTLTDLAATPLLQVDYNHYPPALFYLLAAVGMIFGLLRANKLTITWFSLAAFSAWSLLFFFSSGTLFIPFIAVQAVLLSVLSLLKMSASSEKRFNFNGEQLHGA
jgi:hypothetical protein